MNNSPTNSIWQWFEGSWKNYDIDSIDQLELAHQNGTEMIDLTHGYFALNPGYCADLINLVQINTNTGYVRRIRRVEQQSTSNINIDPSIFLLINPSTISSEETCSICLCSFDEENDDCIRLNECKEHYFHNKCILDALKVKPQCPNCTLYYGILTGNQPNNGTMKIQYSSLIQLPGTNSERTIIIQWRFPPGITENGIRYCGDARIGYLPDNEWGKDILRMFCVAWERRLMFTIGYSITRAIDNCIVWNGIHVKTSPSGGTSMFGYPDETYEQRVRMELNLKGIK